jgi:hypothetical protein
MLLDEYPANKDLRVQAGSTYMLTLRWFDEGGEPHNFTGWTAWMALGTSISDPFQELTTEDGGITLSSEGWIVVKLSAEKTSELAVTVKPVKKGISHLYYNIMMKDPFGEPWIFMKGIMEIVHNVPRPK